MVEVCGCDESLALRAELAEEKRSWELTFELQSKAVEERDALRAENERLRGALEKALASECKSGADSELCQPWHIEARAVLKGPSDAE
jgi:hypothetical protein